MAITNVAASVLTGQAPGDPVYMDLVTLDLDATYPAGGYDFSAGAAARLLLDAQIGAGRTIVDVKATTNHAAPSTAANTLLFQWDPANDKLMVLLNTTAAEVAAGDADLSGVTDLGLLFISK